MSKYNKSVGITKEEYFGYGYSNIYKCQCCGSKLELDEECNYLCLKCGLYHYQIFTDRYGINELTTNVELWNRYKEARKPKSKMDIIREYSNRKLNKKLQSELWIKLGKKNVVAYLKENDIKYKYDGKTDGWANLVILL